MSDADRSVSVAPLLTTVVIIAACTSVLWLYFWHTHDRSRDLQLQALSAELELQRNKEAGLLEQYTAAEEARRQSELALLEARTRLETTEQALARLEAGNWEERYRAATAENYELSERITELELRHAIARDQMENELTLLLGRYSELQNAFEALEDEHAGLAQTHEALENTLAAQSDLDHAYQQLQIDHATAQDELKSLRAQHQALEQSLAESRLELQQSQRASESAVAAAPITTAPVAAAGASSGYRLVRLQSLANAMHGQSSSDRRSILTSVIPTIPDGIDGNELDELVSGMDSADILQVIQATRRHIHTPLDNTSLDRLLPKLNETDAQVALELLQR